MNTMGYLKTIGLVVLLAILAAVPSVYFYRQYQVAQKKLANPTQYQQEEARLLREKVGKLIELPQEEEPTIATVTDAGRLASQAFFAKSQNGDKVLIFTNAKKAVLYRPSTNKIIEVAPVNIGNNQETTATGSAQPVAPTPSVVPTSTPTQIIEPIPPSVPEAVVTPTPTPTL